MAPVDVTVRPLAVRSRNVRVESFDQSRIEVVHRDTMGPVRSNPADTFGGLDVAALRTASVMGSGVGPRGRLTSEQALCNVALLPDVPVAKYIPAGT
jgi:hypothetical protein